MTWDDLLSSLACAIALAVFSAKVNRMVRMSSGSYFVPPPPPPTDPTRTVCPPEGEAWMGLFGAHGELPRG